MSVRTRTGAVAPVDLGREQAGEVSLISQETSSSIPISRVFDGLVETNFDTTEVEPALAESWTVSPDGWTWTCKLRKGIKFHDGIELAAEDVAFNMEAAFTPNISTTRSPT